MTRKKSSYAEKHASAAPEIVSLSSFFHEDNQDLLKVMYAPYNFFDNFLDLPYPRQIAMIEMFRDITRGNIIISPRKNKQTMLDLTYKELEQIHWMTDSYYEEGNAYFPISDDEKKLVRMEYYGSIDKRRDDELSPFYKYFKKKQNRGKFRLKDYDLSASPMWRVFNQFESFRSIAPNVRRYLYQQGFNPDVLKVMSVSDYCDVIHTIYAQNPDSIKARFLPIGYKNRFVMNFMRRCGKDLEQKLIGRGIDERKVKSLCRMMAQYGLCDVERVTITETHFTQRVLDDLKAHRYDVSAYNIGDPISENVMKQVFDDNNEHLLLARDENGIPLSKEDLPRFEVHHKNAVKFANSGDYLAKVNYNNNLMLVEKEIHRAYYHGFDHTVLVNDTNERYFSRINCASPDLCMINGFDIHKDMIFYDLERNVSARNRAAIDRANVVNYYDMQLNRLNNIPEIADKYGIEYFKADLKNEYKNLLNLTKFKVSIPDAEVQTFEEMFSPKPRQRKKGKKQPMIPPTKTGNER